MRKKIFINVEKQIYCLVNAAEFAMGGGCREEMSNALPIHNVKLTDSYYIAEEPVRLESYRKYLKDRGRECEKLYDYRGYIIGVSYTDACGYAEWLSEKDGKEYYLPTEAQWEYAARNMENIPTDRMCDYHIREWCYDYYSPYQEGDAENPAGPVNGLFRCVRGGTLDTIKGKNLYHAEPYYRAAMPENYKHKEDDIYNEFGRHNIGIRLVHGKAPVPKGRQLQYFLNAAVKQNTKDYVHAAPPSDKPYFRKRYIFPVPPDNCTYKENEITGFSSLFRHHHHSPAFTPAINGDILCTTYSTYHEYDTESGLVGCRLRIGEDQWEYPDVFIDAVGVNDHATLMYCDKAGTIYHFWGWPQLKDAYPFQYVYSTDNGENWSEIQYPLFKNKAEYVCAQPVNTCIEASDGLFYIASDSSCSETVDKNGLVIKGGTSVLWRSRDKMQTWENPKARTAGRHTAAVELKDGSILAMGGKNTDIDGYMPYALTSDAGDSYQYFKSCFPAENSGQRPCIIRLKSGILVMCGDYQNKFNKKPDELKDKYGSYVAWSDDEGKKWNFKQLWGTQRRKKTPDMFGGQSTIGYSVLRQSEDGLIHIMCSNVQPLLHLCFNEAWLYSDQTEPEEAELMKSGASKIDDVKEYTEFYDDGSLKCVYHGGIADDGRFLLEGEEMFWYSNGNVMWKACYHLGRKIGMFEYFDSEGCIVKRIEYPKEISQHIIETVYTFYPDSSIVRTKAVFVDRKAEGMAYMYDRQGNVKKECCFKDGKAEADYTSLEE